MNHYSLEVLAKQNQKKLVSDQLHEQWVRKNIVKAPLKASRIGFTVLAIVLLYFWLFL